jgi:hypothetical protein
MKHLILTQPSEDYGQAISHELWMLARPRGISDGETSQFYCGVMSHPDGTKVAIGPIDGDQSVPVHAQADVSAFVNLMSEGVTAEEATAIEAAITEAKGGGVNILQIVEASPSLSPNLITREQMEATGWFSTDEV